MPSVINQFQDLETGISSDVPILCLCISSPQYDVDYDDVEYRRRTVATTSATATRPAIASTAHCSADRSANTTAAPVPATN
jgi:hypothetical protein